MYKYCYNCGKKLPKEATFCSDCGNRQSEESTTDEQNGDKKIAQNSISENYVDYGKERLLNSLEQDIEYFQKKQSTYDSIDDLNVLKTQIEEPNGLAMFFIGIILFIILYIFAFDKFLELNVKNLFFGFVAFGVVIPQTMYERRKQSVLNKRLSIEEELESKENELKSYFDSYKKSVVSFEYSNPKTINLLKHSISSGRADNIKEAINCMLDDYHKQQLLIKQDEIVENSKVAANAAKRTAVYSLGTFINTRKQ